MLIEPSVVSFGPSDILLSIESSENTELRAELLRDVPSPPMLIFNHVCVENAVILEASGFLFFRELAAEAPKGAIFIFIDASPRLFPRLLSEMKDAAGEFRFEMMLQSVHGQGQPEALIMRVREANGKDLLPAWTEVLRDSPTL